MIMSAKLPGRTSNLSLVTLRAETASTKSLMPLRSSSREKNARRHTGFSFPIICASNTPGVNCRDNKALLSENNLLAGFTSGEDSRETQTYNHPLLCRHVYFESTEK